MKPVIHTVFGAAALLAVSAAALTSCGPQPAAPQDKILIAGSFWDTIAVVNRSAGDAIEWKYGLPKGSECNSVEIVPGTGDVLLSYRRGARVVRRDSTNGGGTIVWDYTDVADTAELQTATRLPDGGYLLAICGTPARIVELDSTGLNVRREVRYDLGIQPAHAQFRRVAKSRNGNYLIPIISNGKVLEIKDDSTLVMEYNVGGSPFSVQELANGNLFVALGDGHCSIEIERAGGNLVQRIDSISGVPMHFIAQSERLNNGHTLISNWQGHLPAKRQTAAQLVEIDSAGLVVWAYDGRSGRPVKGGGVDFISAFYPFTE
ncbi:hypothetical protein [uncultured Rikenella sp.]|uniref:beta-propeller domain-containing protein n=1 Tax=uncultured Rikenella sp. TaxID=368003 RepID=UPI00261C8D30|nr:hypothetical protein [uncultured Rikenella sp.]